MPEGQRVVAVVDDDASVRVSLGRLLRAAGYAVTSYAGGAEFLSSPVKPDCLLLDLDMPGMNGAGVLACLATLGRCMPTVIITGNIQELQADSVRTLPLLHKPFDDQTLLDAVATAIYSGGATPASAGIGPRA